MKKERKKIRERGKLRFSKVFQTFNPEDKVAIVREISLKSNIPRRMQGKTGTIESKRGRSYMVKINDGKKEKRFIISPVHLRKIKNTENPWFSVSQTPEGDVRW